MSQTHDAQRTTFPFGNPFRMIVPKGSHLSPKLLSLLTAFEQTLGESLRKLKPKNTSEVLSVSWLRHAMALLTAMHTNIKTLTTVLQFPVSKWDQKWIDMYLDDSVKWLDICNGLTSELSRLDQTQLFLKYSVHTHSSLHDWVEKIHSKSPKLENCMSIIQELANTLHLLKVTNSAKGKVLMRALYGVKIITAFVCSVFTAALSGCAKPLMDLHISGEFLWVAAFNDLQASVNGEFRNHFALGNSVVLKELVAINAGAYKLHNKSTYINDKEGEEEERLKELSLDLIESVDCFAKELDLLCKQLEAFFRLILEGRNALLWSLTTSDVQAKRKVDKIR